ncbi:glycoside hydrolase family 78 protein [Compostibacter hankyongensis]|uniref:alpha-L-rhamnosidase n=2 Tax=Compostibacter hankyongensis TaxID=1007089 RepID=A0ABP8G8J3_9BACT
MQHPAGVEDAHPFFGWKLSAAARDIHQTAYRIVVASSPEKLEQGADLWDSGKVPSAENAFVRYGGRPLEPARKYYWSVEVWTGNGESSRSPADYFITGLSRESDWQTAKWIAFERLQDSLKVFPGVHGSGDGLGNKALKRAVIPFFRKDFRLRKPLSQAFAYISGQGQYAFFINGARVDTGFLNPAWSDYTKRCYYNAFEVTRQLKQGANTLGAVAGTGFLYINRERYRKLVIAGGYPMIRMFLVLRYTDGTADTVVTDASWKTAPSPIAYSSIYGGEDYDARREQPGWNRPGFRDDTWKPALTVPGPGGKMEVQQSPPVHINRSFPPLQHKASGDTMQVYDFGQNASGIIRLRVKGPAGYRVRVIPAELITPDGRPDQGATGHPYYYDYTLKGGDAETWQPLFTYYGLRYAGVEVRDPEGHILKDGGPVKISGLTFLHTETAVEQTGSFSCSNPLFNRIFELIRWGIRNNLSNVATDCPHREKLGWLEETHLIGNSIRYNFDIRNFYHKVIEDMQDAQLPNGLVPDIAPEYVVFDDGFRDSPEWGSACVLLPWYVYQWYGDTSALRESYTMMKRYVDYLENKAGGNMLSYGLGDWFDLGPKPPGVSQLTPLGVTATAFYFYDADIVGKVAGILGDRTAASRYGSLAERIRTTFNKQYFDPATGVYATGSQTAYAIPLYFGLVPEQYRNKVLENLKDSVAKHHYALTAGDIGFRYLIQALQEGGAYELIYKMNNRDDVPGYGYQLRQGATALTESWQALRNVSNDHMMLGHLMEWLYGGLAGIGQQPGTTGYRQLLVDPQWVKDISRVKASYNSINGPIQVSWMRESGSRLHLRVTVPPNTTAAVVLPTDRPDRIKESGMPLSKGIAGIAGVSHTEKTTIVKTGSGTYDFSFDE